MGFSGRLPVQGGVVWLDLGLASSAVTQITCVFYEKKGASWTRLACSVTGFVKASIGAISQEAMTKPESFTVLDVRFSRLGGLH